MTKSVASLLIVLTLAACQDSGTNSPGDSSSDSSSDPESSNGPETDTDADTDSDTDADTDADADTDTDTETADETLGCDNPDLVWKNANKTWYTSYPDPGSEECIEYNGCEWAGWFAACDDQKSEEWVAAHNIVAAFPDFTSLRLHDLCLRRGSNTIVVTVLDTCGDADCDGCCTRNLGDADQLIDIESYTNDRFGVEDGPIEWADLGPTQGSGCD